MIQTSRVMAAIALVACGCGKAASADPDLAAGVNAVAAGLPSKLVFENLTIEVGGGSPGTHSYRIAVPRGWKRFDDKLAPQRPELGKSRTHIAVSASCTPPGTGDLKRDLDRTGEPCRSQDWGPIVAAHVAEQRGSSLKVLEDDEGPGRRTLVVELGGIAFPEPAMLVQVYLWKPATTAFHSCSATLEGALRADAAAFERACLTMLVEDR